MVNYTRLMWTPDLNRTHPFRRVSLRKLIPHNKGTFPSQIQAGVLLHPGFPTPSSGLHELAIHHGVHPSPRPLSSDSRARVRS